MFTKRCTPILRQARFMASEASSASEGSNMNALLGKLNKITNEVNTETAKNSSKTFPKKNNTKYTKKTSGNSGNSGNYTRNNDNNNSGKRASYNRTGDNNRKRNTNRDGYKKGGNRKETSSYQDRSQKSFRQNRNRSNNRVPTVSRYDRIKNPKKKTEDKETTDYSALSAQGQSFAKYQEAKVAFIRRNIQSNKPTLNFTSNKEFLLDFIYSRAVNRSLKYVEKPLFSGSEPKPLTYESQNILKSELELTKDKLGYDTKSRVLRALEQLTSKRGFKLIDTAKKGYQILPYNVKIYPFANTTLPSNLSRPFASLKLLDHIPKEEIEQTFASVVQGKRPELIFDPKKEYKTEQLKINAQVVAYALNRNSQLQVDNLHLSMSKVMLGEGTLKELPQPVLAPKKI